jgi:hypothetical protein
MAMPKGARREDEMPYSRQAQITRVTPRHPRFVDDVLRPLARRAAAGEDPHRLAEELYETAVHPWALAQARAQCRGLPAHADANEVTSQVLRLAWEACLRMDWQRVESWPALLERKVAHGRVEAARAEDWLSRRERVHRRRYQRAVLDQEQRVGRTLTQAECLDVATDVVPASKRVDWARELLAAKHPSTVAQLPEVAAGRDIATDVEERLLAAERADRLHDWLAVLARQDPRLAEDLLRWGGADEDRNRALPVRLARRVEPYTPLLAGLLMEE